MLCHRLELTVDLDPSWPKERIGELYNILMTRLTVASCSAQREMLEAGFKSRWLESEPSTIRISDARGDVDVICRFGDEPSGVIDTRHPFRGGVRIYRPVRDLALIPLPKRMWATLGDRPSPCGCPWCVGADSYLDTLVVDCNPNQRPTDSHRAWLTHAPIYQRSPDRVVITLQEPAKFESSWITEIYGAIVEAQIRKSNTIYPVRGCQAHGLFGLDSLWRHREFDRSVVVQMLRKEPCPLTQPKVPAIWKPCRPERWETIVSIPKEFWTPLEGSHRPCGCDDCAQGGRVGNALRVRKQEDPESVDLAELIHESIWY